MNGSFVADSSVGVAWAVSSQATSATDDLLSEVDAGRPFAVPSLWWLEVGNSLLMLKRRGRLSKERYERARNALILLTPELDDSGPQAPVVRISQLAEDHGLSVYDATYVELAIRRSIPLATRDARMSKAARACGVPLLL
jgi:predicted nucleic acid-binding protein